MATQADIRDFIAMVTGGFVPLRDLIVKGQEMGLNVKDTVEIVANLQPSLVPSNIMAKMNAPAMFDNPYTAPRIGFDEAVTEYGVQEEPPTSIFQEQQQYFGPELEGFDYDAGEQVMEFDDPRPTNQTGTGSMSMSDIINTNLQASQAEAGELGEGGIAPSGPRIFTPMHGDPLPPRPIDPVSGPAETLISNPMPTRPMGPMGPPRVATDPINYRKKELGRPPIQVDIEPQVPPTPPTPVNFSYGDTQTGMMDAAATLRSPFTSSMDRQAAQDYMSGIVSNIRLPF